MVLHLKEGLTAGFSLKLHFRHRLVFIIIDCLFQVEIVCRMHAQMYIYE